MESILLVEDDSTLALGLEYSLKNEGYHVDMAKNVAQGKKFLQEKNYQLIILDITLPDGSGYELCEYIRREKDSPIIFLTALDEEVNIVMGLELGGDDYITKPFKIRELLSRIRAVLRRTSKKNPEGILKSGDITVYQMEGKVMRQHQEIALTPSEYKLLVYFMSNPNRILARSSILEKLWDIEGDFIDDNTLSVYVKRLREKIEVDSSAPQYIKTIRGIGYKWDNEAGGV